MLRVLSRLAVLSLSLVLSACQSQPPYNPIPVDPAGTGRYATDVLCTPYEGAPTRSKAAVGAPDDISLDTNKCETLDVFFGGGNLTTVIGQPDLVVHLADETPFTCPQDCPIDCGNGACEALENYLNCREDCLNLCGNGKCDDLCLTKPDRICDPLRSETCFNCPEDCGECNCGQQPCMPRCPQRREDQTCCGDNRCDVIHYESCLSCPQDCGSCLKRCGDGKCDRIPLNSPLPALGEPLQFETCLNCPQDCGSCRLPSCDNPEKTCDEPGGLVETSHKGLDYQIVGFITYRPQDAQGRSVPRSCEVVIQRNWGLVFFDSCNTVSNVLHLRITTFKGIARNPHIDAFEALSFQPKKEQ